MKAKTLSIFKAYLFAPLITILLAGAVSAQGVQEVDRNSITSEATQLKDWKGGSLYQIGVLDLVVLNGTYKEMGRRPAFPALSSSAASSLTTAAERQLSPTR